MYTDMNSSSYSTGLTTIAPLGDARACDLWTVLRLRSDPDNWVEMSNQFDLPCSCTTFPSSVTQGRLSLSLFNTSIIPVSNAERRFSRRNRGQFSNTVKLRADLGRYGYCEPTGHPLVCLAKCLIQGISQLMYRSAQFCPPTRSPWSSGNDRLLARD